MTGASAPTGAEARSADPRPRGDDASAFIRTFPCASCGAKLSFAPGTRSLRCEFCGEENDIPEEGDARVEELDLEVWMKALEGRQETVEGEQVQCTKCGAKERLEGAQFASRCSFCGAPVTSTTYAGRLVKPRSMVPFQLDRAAAQQAFRQWLRWRWLAPRDLKRYAQSDAGLTGIYLPFWTYDCQTASDYTGQRGTKHDKSTSWSAVSGHVEHFHDDVMVLASRTLPRDLQGALESWDTQALVPYKPEFVSGFHAEAYQMTLAESYPVAREMIDATIRRLIRRDIGGDDQRIDSVSTRYGKFTFKHVLLPAWISAYRYRDKAYRFVVNAQTGETCGESPISWWKVALIVAILLFLVYITH